MQILARYLAESFVKNLALALTGLCGLFFFQSLISQVNEYPFSQLLILTLYDLPQMMVMVAPPAAMTATVLTLSSFAKTSELVAMFSIGVSVKQIASIILPLVLVLSCLSLAVQDRVLPSFFEKKTLFYMREIKQRQDFYLDVAKEKIWYRSDRLIYNIRTFDPKQKKIVGLDIYELTPEFTLAGVLHAKEAVYRDSSWVLKDVKRTRFDAKTGYPYNEGMNELPIALNEKPEDFQMIEREVDRLRIKQLIKFIELNRRSGIDSKGYEVKLHSRFSLAIIPLILAMVAIPFSVGHHRQGRLAKDLAIVFTITFVYWMSFSVGLSLGKNGSIPPFVGAWSPTVLFGLFGLYKLRFSRNT
jgi:LPS export ABC transporter permease LptG